MVTAKIGGSSSPCTKRQKMTWLSVGASAVIVAGISSSAIATTIRRFRPITSERAGERRGRGHSERTGGDDQAGVGGADAVFARHHRQHGLRRIQVQKRTDGAEGDGDAAWIGEHGQTFSTNL